MALVKRFVLAATILVLAAPIALAGPNAGGVLVLHATTLAYTLDTPTHIGLSGVACGQDGPATVPPSRNVCPPYDPIGGANPCNPLAADPTSSIAAGVASVWYIMAAFPEGSCPRLKTLGFRIKYDPEKVLIVGQGVAAAATEVTTLPVVSDQTGGSFPENRAGVGIAFVPTAVKTSLLQEIWWFAGYSYPGATDATFAVEVLRGSAIFGDDATIANEDPIADFGTLGLGGAVGHNPTPVPQEPTGSCCAPAGTCTVTMEADCTEAWTLAAVCSPNPCVQPTGSCCAPAGTCTVTTQVDCTGIWTLSGACVPNNCPAPNEQGACCTPQRGCTLTLQGACATPNQWHAEWIVCDPNACLTLQGACCAPDGTCTLTTMSTCVPPLIWHGDLTSCDPGSCPLLPTERTSWGRIKATYRTK